MRDEGIKDMDWEGGVCVGGEVEGCLKREHIEGGGV